LNAGISITKGVVSNILSLLVALMSFSVCENGF